MRRNESTASPFEISDLMVLKSNILAGVLEFCFAGYHLGQFNQQGEKRQPYDEDIRVPLIVRGPGVTANTSTNALALNIDLVSITYNYMCMRDLSLSS